MFWNISGKLSQQDVIVCLLQATFYSSPELVLPPVYGSKVVITPLGPLEPSDVQIVVCVPPGKLLFTEDRNKQRYQLPFSCVAGIDVPLLRSPRNWCMDVAGP
jgi:hypothetical protein